MTIKMNSGEWVSKFCRDKSGNMVFSTDKSRANAKDFKSIGQAKQFVNLFGGIIHGDMKK